MSAFGLDEVGSSGDVAVLEPVRYWSFGVDVLELPLDVDAVDAVDGGELVWGDGESFALSHAGFEGDVEHECPHVVVVWGVGLGVVFADGGCFGGVYGLCGLSWCEDFCFCWFVSGWGGCECRVVGMIFSRTAAASICLMRM